MSSINDLIQILMCNKFTELAFIFPAVHSFGKTLSHAFSIYTQSLYTNKF